MNSVPDPRHLREDFLALEGPLSSKNLSPYRPRSVAVCCDESQLRLTVFPLLIFSWFCPVTGLPKKGGKNR